MCELLPKKFVNFACNYF